jgi:D-alanyl-D-alanine carboxypeptidase/D-alanyl-D-alanine-endopeptidase (penicillin-binding protein 4)
MRIYGFFVLIFNVLFVFSQNNVEKSILIFASESVNKSSAISFLARDVQNGEKIAEYNPLNPITSASTTKLFSTATAFELLGKDKKSVTRIYLKGKVDADGVLHGDIWIRGGGDVSLGSRFFSEPARELDFLNAWSDSLILKGIKKIDGAIIADASEFGYKGVPDGWNEADIGNYYGAGAGGLNFFDNTIKLYFKTGAAGAKTQLVDVFPKVPGLNISNYVLSANVAEDNSYVHGLPFSLERKATGKLPVNQNKYLVKGSMPDPEFLIAHEFVRVINLKGIAVLNGAKSLRINKLEKPSYNNDFKLLFQQESKTVKDIAYWTNLKSVNLFAEGLLNWIGYFSNGNGSTESGLKVMMDFWTNKINTNGLIIKDGSGLSRLDAISAMHFCELLKYMYSSDNYLDFRATLPIAGQTGTIRNLCKGGAGEGRVYAKSGTINNVKAYSGYVDSKSGKKIAFAFIVNNFNCSSSVITSKMENVLNALAEY